MAFNYEQAQCTGRGFSAESADGFLKNFHDWVTRSPAASPVAKSTGGPGWFIIDDQSIVSGGSANKEDWIETNDAGLGASFNTLAEITAITDGEFKITIDGVAADVAGVDFSSAVTWEDVAATLQTAIRAESLSANDGFDNAVVQHYEQLRESSPAQQDEVLIHGFRIVAGEPDMAIVALAAVTSPSGTAIHGSSYLHMASPESGTHTADPFIVVSDQASPTPFSGAKFLKVGMITASSGEVFADTYMYWNPTIHKGFGLWGAWKLLTLDDAEFVYDFRGGEEFLSIAARIGTSWDHIFIDEWTDYTNFIETSSASGNVTAEVAAGATSFDVGAGEGVNFTVGNFYFLIDLDNSEAVDFVEIASISTDTITLEEATVKRYKSGALLTSYYQRVYAAGDEDINPNYPVMAIPIRSLRTGEYGINTSSNLPYNYSEAEMSYAGEVLANMNPTDKGVSAYMHPLIGELNDTAGGDARSGNQFYGTGKNIAATGLGSMAQMLNGRTISGAAWVYFQLSSAIQRGGSSTIAMLMPNYNTT